MVDKLSQETATIILLAFVLIIEYKTSWFTKSGRVFTGVIAFGTLIYGWYDFLIKTNLFQANIVELRVENTLTGPHDFIWILIFIGTTIIFFGPMFGIKTPKTITYNLTWRIKNRNYGLAGKLLKIDPMTALAAMGFVISSHELNWYAIYFIINQTNAPAILLAAAPYIAFLVILLEIAYAFKPFNKEQAVIITISETLFDITWAMSGFEITVGFAGVTQFIHDLAVNNLENESWVIPLSLAAIYYYVRYRKNAKTNQ